MKIKAIIKTLINRNSFDPVDNYKLVECNLTPDQYISVYKTIGEKYCWWMKQTWSESQLQNHIDSDNIHMYWIIFDNNVIGFCEIHSYQSYDYIQYFGLYEEYIGKGHGINSLKTVLSVCQENIFTTTNNLDHENALNVYERVGFTLHNSHEEMWDIPDTLNIILTERNKIWLQS